MRARKMLIAGLLFAAWSIAAPLAAQPQSQTVPPEQLAREAIELMVKALGGMLANLPHYAAPEIDAAGNITIRRLNPPTARRPAPPSSAPGEYSLPL
jgi:hypothetical protein